MLKNKIILVLLLFISFFTNTGFTNVSQKPRTIYKVYLNVIIIFFIQLFKRII